MVISYSEKERKALMEKLEAPNKDVICPRCGKRLVYIRKGNSCAVICETPNCLRDAIRGI